MGLIDRLEGFVLPAEVDFFQRLREQSDTTRRIIAEVHSLYVTHEAASADALSVMIQQAQDMRRRNLNELYQVFVAPMDKEAISRAYINLDWVVMSIEHMQTELGIYQITDMSAYRRIPDLLKEEMDHVHDAFSLLGSKDTESFSKSVFEIVHCDNELIKEYANQVAILFTDTDIKRIITHKEILNQLKEISKRIRICANDLEDMLFKLD